MVIQLSCVCKTLTKTNIKENHTLDLTKIMQYDLLGKKQFINLYIKLSSCSCNNWENFKAIQDQRHRTELIIDFYWLVALSNYKGNKNLLKVNKRGLVKNSQWISYILANNITHRGQLNANCCNDKQQFQGLTKCVTFSREHHQFH